MTLIERIFEAMSEDDGNSTKYSDHLKKLYEKQNEKGKKIIDEALTCICGWSLETLLENEENEDE